MLRNSAKTAVVLTAPGGVMVGVDSWFGRSPLHRLATPYGSNVVGGS